MKKQILVAALAVIGSSVFLSPAAQSHDHNYYRNSMPYGYGYGNPGYGYGYNNNNRNGFIRGLRHERREVIRNERRAVRHWDHRRNGWF